MSEYNSTKDKLERPYSKTAREIFEEEEVINSHKKLHRIVGTQGDRKNNLLKKWKDIYKRGISIEQLSRMYPRNSPKESHESRIRDRIDLFTVDHICNTESFHRYIGKSRNENIDELRYLSYDIVTLSNLAGFMMKDLIKEISTDEEDRIDYTGNYLPCNRNPEPLVEESYPFSYNKLRDYNKDIENLMKEELGICTFDIIYARKSLEREYNHKFGLLWIPKNDIDKMKSRKKNFLEFFTHNKARQNFYKLMQTDTIMKEPIIDVGESLIYREGFLDLCIKDVLINLKSYGFWMKENKDDNEEEKRINDSSTAFGRYKKEYEDIFEEKVRQALSKSFSYENKGEGIDQIDAVKMCCRENKIELYEAKFRPPRYSSGGIVNLEYYKYMSKYKPKLEKKKRKVVEYLHQNNTNTWKVESFFVYPEWSKLPMYFDDIKVLKHHPQKGYYLSDENLHS